MTDTADWIKQIVNGEASSRLKDMASKGLLPFPPPQMIQVLSILSADGDEAIKSQARDTMGGLPRAIIQVAAGDSGTDPGVIRSLKEIFSGDEEILSQLAANPATPVDIQVWLSGCRHVPVLEVLSRNQRTLRKNREVLLGLIANPALPARLKGYLIEENERQRAKDKSILEDEVADEIVKAEVEFDEILTKDHEKDDAAVPFQSRKELQEVRQKSIYQMIRMMNSGEKLILAMRGNKEARMILIRDANKQVATKVLGSPRLNENEVEMIAKMTNVCDEVLRGIAQNREWIAKHNIVKALVLNPKTPVGISLPLVNNLSVRELGLVGKNRNIPEVLRRTAARLYKLRSEMRGGG